MQRIVPRSPPSSLPVRLAELRGLVDQTPSARKYGTVEAASAHYAWGFEELEAVVKAWGAIPTPGEWFAVGVLASKTFHRSIVQITEETTRKLLSTCGEGMAATGVALAGGSGGRGA